jgi:DNA repair exonuclease SbcCD nuclease subunit
MARLHMTGEWSVRRLATFTFIAALAASISGQPAAVLPNKPDSVKFAVIGDSGTGDRAQYDVAEQMTRVREQVPYDLVLMVGDNFYGGQQPADLLRKFDRPYKRLLDAGVTFRAALGNHDEPQTVDYAPLNMANHRYYTFARGNVRFFALDTTALDSRQLQWIDTALGEAVEDWKICYFHHPLYSNGGRHGSSVDIRVLLEPLLVKYGVNVVFSGHDHAYERLTPQKGVYYFVAGASGQLRKGDLEPTATTAAAFDQDQSFMVVEIAGAELFFETISRTGVRVDSGTIQRARRTS